MLKASEREMQIQLQNEIVRHSNLRDICRQQRIELKETSQKIQDLSSRSIGSTDG